MPSTRLTTPLLRLTTHAKPPSHTTLQTRPYAWSGRPTSDHVIHRKDNDPLDIQAQASKAAHAERAERENEGKSKGHGNGGTGQGDKTGSQATSQSDHYNANKRAQEEFPEAPGPVIGMNDERGKVSFSSSSSCCLCFVMVFHGLALEFG